MALLPMPRKPAPKLSDIVPLIQPQHDPVSIGRKYTSPKELFSALLQEAKEG